MSCRRTQAYAFLLAAFLMLMAPLAGALAALTLYTHSINININIGATAILHCHGSAGVCRVHMSLVAVGQEDDIVAQAADAMH
jgi:hypothetical protein